MSCSTHDELDTSNIELTVNSNEELTYVLGNLITEGGYEITKQADSYIISEIKIDQDIGTMIYFYKSKETFQGQEKVQITRRESIGNGNFNRHIMNFTINVN